MNEQYYEKEVIRYKKKYRLFRSEVSTYNIRMALINLGYTDWNNVKSLLSSNSSELKDLILKIAVSLPDGRGNISSIMYSSVVSELLYLANIDFELHVGFVLPVKISDISKYDNCYLVNYMYVKTNETSFHYLNGVLDDSSFTYIKDNLVEV